jgi:hypothetical protein
LAASAGVTITGAPFGSGTTSADGKPFVVLGRGVAMSVISLLLNLLWIVFGGLWMALGWVIACPTPWDTWDTWDSATQVETLRRLRSAGSQVVRVEHVGGVHGVVRHPGRPHSHATLDQGRPGSRHQDQSMTAGGFSYGRDVPLKASAAARLMRAYATQVETLRRLRNGGSQVVRVEHVHVNEGGQDDARPHAPRPGASAAYEWRKQTRRKEA